MSSMTAIKDNLPPGITIRKALPDDHRRVVDIRENVYDGLDYLDHLYPHYMANPNVYCYIMEKQGRAIQFGYRLVVDDGQTVIAGGARIAVDYEHQGISKVFRSYMTTDALKRRPSIKRYTFTAFFNHFWQENLKRKTDAYSVIFTRQLYSVWATKKLILDFKTNPSIVDQRKKLSEDIWRPGLQEMVEILTRESYNKNLFPDGHLIAYWEPLKLVASNISYVNETSIVYFSGNRSKDQLSAMSILSLVFAPKGILRYDIELYGSAESSLLNHVCECLDYLRQIQDYGPEARVEVIFYFPMTTKRSFFDDLAKLGGWEPGAWSKNTHYFGARRLEFVNSQL